MEPGICTWSSTTAYRISIRMEPTRTSVVGYDPYFRSWFMPFSPRPVGVQGNMVHFHDRRTYSNLSDLAELYVPTPASSPHSSGVIRLAHSPQSNLTPQGGLLAQGKEIAGYMPARRLKLRTAHSGQVRTPKRRSDLLPFLS